MEENSKKQGRFFSAQNIGYFSAMGILFLTLGLIISTQTKRHIIAEGMNLPVERQLNGLVSLLKETQSKKGELEKQLLILKRQVHTMNRDSLSSGFAGRQYKMLYEMAGLTTIKGDGVLIKLEDRSPERILKSNDLIDNDGRINSDDLLKMVNELKASGAKAIAINNQRLVTTSEISTAGSSILVNQSKINPPYLIKAVGDTDTMISALKMRGGVVESLEVFGIKVTMEKKSSLKVPAYDKAFS